MQSVVLTRDILTCSSQFIYASNTLALSWGRGVLVPLPTPVLDIWQRLDAFLVVNTGRALLATSGQW